MSLGGLSYSVSEDADMNVAGAVDWEVLEGVSGSGSHRADIFLEGVTGGVPCAAGTQSINAKVDVLVEHWRS